MKEDRKVIFGKFYRQNFSKNDLVFPIFLHMLKLIRNGKKDFIRESRATMSSGGGISYHYEYTPNGKLKAKYVAGRRVFCYTYTKTGIIKTRTDRKGSNIRHRILYID